MLDLGMGEWKAEFGGRRLAGGVGFPARETEEKCWTMERCLLDSVAASQANKTPVQFRIDGVVFSISWDKGSALRQGWRKRQKLTFTQLSLLTEHYAMWVILIILLYSILLSLIVYSFNPFPLPIIIFPFFSGRCFKTLDQNSCFH